MADFSATFSLNILIKHMLAELSDHELVLILQTIPGKNT